MNSLTLKLQRIQLFATDFDGVHTDGMVYVNHDGMEYVRCSRKDGLGYAMLKKAGINACVISKEANPVVVKRCKKLKIPYYCNVNTGQEKLAILKSVAAKLKLAPDQVLYMGDDINDCEPLEFAGVAITVKDCHPSLLKIADYITSRKGGNHAIREVCEMVILAKGLPLNI